MITTKRRVATLNTLVLEVKNVTHFCLDIRIILLAKIQITMNYITYSGQLIKEQEVFTRNKPSGDNWNQWKMEIIKPKDAVKLAFIFEFMLRKEGAGIAVLIDSLNVFFGTCNANDGLQTAGAAQTGEYPTHEGREKPFKLSYFWFNISTIYSEIVFHSIAYYLCAVGVSCNSQI